jgi:uncharacterized protein (TIGR02996 family)
MSPDNPFLKALLAQPDDDTLRLAMADWLDENDQPARAEFIRLQIELTAGIEDRDRRIALELRQAELLNAHDREWVKPLAEVLGSGDGEWGGWVFRRGFVEYFHLPAPVANRHGEKLARLTPVRELYLSPCTSVSVIALCKKPWLRSVTALYLRGDPPNDAAPPINPQLRSDPLNARAIRALIDSPHLANLKVIEAVKREDVSNELAKAFHRRFGRHLVPSRPE